tara:strand:+ start:2315 stop:2563 length:249 start_codon:yes stop_codon:yes gene_type:complete
VPEKTIVNQPKTTIKYPSLLFITFDGFFEISITMIPMLKQIIDALIISNKKPSLYMKLTKLEDKIAMELNNKSNPIIYIINL